MAMQSLLFLVLFLLGSPCEDDDHRNHDQHGRTDQEKIHREATLKGGDFGD